MNRDAYYIGIDVGTGSARAGVFDGAGRLRGSGRHDLTTWRPAPDFVEQSTEDVWQACAAAVREAVREAAIDPAAVRGLGFDATCSLALVDEEGRPVSVSPDGDDRRNVIVWMDHRATAQADAINTTGHDVLRYVGGGVSPEMQTPKLLWLKQHLPGAFRRAAHFFDLADYLTYRAAGDATRSLCTTVCKWTYLGHQAEAGGTDGWAADFWRTIGLGEIADEGFRRVGTRVRPMGEAVGAGLTATAAEDLGLRPGTAVGVGIIDAHAGGLGVLGIQVEEEGGDGADEATGGFARRLALIGGTSSCHMTVAAEPRFIPGVWGPYHSAMVPGLWLNEGGQSATGALVDHVIFSHARGADLRARAVAMGRTVYELLNETLDRLAADAPFPAALTRERHVLPYFHGNRSPRADASLRGAATGLRLGDGEDELALQYLATIQAIAYGTRHIIEAVNEQGYRIDTLVVTGGGSKNPLFLRAHADATGCRVVVPRQAEPVLLGAAMLGAAASGDHATVEAAMRAMSGAGEVISPAGGGVAAYHDAKYRVFHRLHHDTQAYRALMDAAGTPSAVRPATSITA